MNLFGRHCLHAIDLVSGALEAAPFSPALITPIKMLVKAGVEKYQQGTFNSL